MSLIGVPKNLFVNAGEIFLKAQCPLCHPTNSVNNSWVTLTFKLNAILNLFLNQNSYHSCI